MFPLAVALLIVGYGVAYWGAQNLRNGGKGPGFGEVFGLSAGLTTEESLKGLGKLDQGQLGKISPNLTGQPPTTVDNPPGGVWT